MKMKIELTTDEMLNVIDAVMDEAIDRGYDPIEDENQFNDLIAVVDAALSAMGIEYDVVDDEEEDFSLDEDDFDFDDDDDEEEMESIIYDCDGHRGISASDARLLMRCVADVMHNQFGYLPDEVIDILIQNETMRIASEWNIEVVDTDE